MSNKKRTRANNGMGSIRKRADGRWEGRYTAPDGSQKSIYGETEKDVVLRLREKLHDIDMGVWREPSKMTVDGWLNHWLKDFQGHTTGRTVITYSSALDNYVRPVIGFVKMENLKPLHIVKVLSAMSDKSPTTQRQTYHIIKNAIKSAIISGIIRDDPTVGVRLPRSDIQQFNVVDRQQIPDFVAAVQETQFPNELLLMLYTGLRVGEIRGLRWDDWSETTLNVERQLYAHAHGIGFGPPKYGEVRTIELPVEAVQVLHAQKKRQAEQRLAAGDKWQDTDLSSGLIFRQRLGQIHTNTSLARATKKAGAAIGIPDLHPHDLRHSYAVAAIRSGADIKTVQHNLGHHSASVTLNVYAAYTTDAGKESAKKLSEYLKNTD